MFSTHRRVALKAVWTMTETLAPLPVVPGGPDQRVFEWRRRWEGCSAVQVVDPNKGSSLPVQNSDRVEQKALLPLLVVKVTGDENRLPKLNSCLP